MKKVLSIVLVLVLTLTGCVGLVPDVPEKLTLGENSYKTGFYGTMFPNEYELSDEKLEVDGIVLNCINHESFELYHADIGSYTEGTIYCSEQNYERALSFYNDPENYSYHCILGVDSDTQNAKTIKLTDVDITKFNALLDFADQSNYDPFNKKHNAKIDKVELPMPDDNKDTQERQS